MAVLQLDQLGIHHAHSSTGEVGKHHSKAYGYQQQWFKLFGNTQIEQHTAYYQHYNDSRLRKQGAEGRHLI